MTLIDYCSCVIPRTDTTSATHCGFCGKPIRVWLQNTQTQESKSK